MSRADLSSGDNFGVKLPAVAYGDNEKPYATLMGAVVVENTITKLLPLKVRDNGDGTATLLVKTEA